MQFGQPGMLRHLSFKSMKELMLSLLEKPPLMFIAQMHTIEFPTGQPMQEKRWLGADLIFDIDGKDLRMPCVPSHSYAVCIQCGVASPPETTKKIDHILARPAVLTRRDYVSIPCSKCIDGSKRRLDV